MYAYAAKNLGFQRSPPAYLSLNEHHRHLLRSALHGGVSYASAGAGILDSTVSTNPLLYNGVLSILSNYEVNPDREIYI
jgi:hypothetical protein